MRSKSPPIAGLVYTSLQLPESLHEGMKAVRQARRTVELADVPLNRLYREAVEFYLASRPQRELLERYRALAADTRSGPEADGVLCA